MEYTTIQNANWQFNPLPLHITTLIIHVQNCKLTISSYVVILSHKNPLLIQSQFLSKESETPCVCVRETEREREREKWRIQGCYHWFFVLDFWVFAKRSNRHSTVWFTRNRTSRSDSTDSPRGCLLHLKTSPLRKPPNLVSTGATTFFLNHVDSE